MSEPAEARFCPASDQSLLVSFGEEITAAAHTKVRRFLRLLESMRIPGVCNLHPAYSSVLIRFNLLEVSHAQLESLLRPALRHLDELPLPEPRTVEIPVCYGGEFGVDLTDLAKTHAMSEEEVIALHSSATYTVCFLGFVPGFAYLSGLPGALATPRLASPRRTVPPGSVGIAGSQTGVYPLATAGGWRLIARTPLRMFRPEAAEMNRLAIGDQVRFRSIAPGEFGRRFESCR